MKGTVIMGWARSGSRNSRPRVRNFLNDTEDVVPATGVEPRGVLPQLVEDLFHLERGRVGLDQDRGANGASRDAEGFLGIDEHVVPEPRLKMALQLGQMEVRAPLPASICRWAQWKK